MALKHYLGVPKPVTAAWTCPTCQHQNTGPLEAGCSACKAGADARKAEPTAPPEVSEAERNFNAFVTVTYPLGLSPSTYTVAQQAYMAGVRWAQTRQEIAAMTQPAAPVPTAEGGYTLILATPDQKDADCVDRATHQTILHALASYRDNVLAYGAIRGQLTAQEVSELIVKLTPKDEEV